MTSAFSNTSQFAGPDLMGAVFSPVRAPSSLGEPVKVGLAMRFLVEVDGLSLGHWSSCQGLKVDFRFTTVEQGGEYNRHTVLPEKVEYGDVTLKRAVHAEGSRTVHEWLESAVKNWISSDDRGGGFHTAGTARITVLDVRQRPIFEYELVGVYPKSWSGPDLDANSGRVAVETLVLAFDGFRGWV